MDLDNVKTVAQHDLAGRGMGAVASFCMARNKTAVLEKFKELGRTLEETLTAEEMEELRREVNNAIGRRAEELAAVIVKNHSKEEIARLTTELRNSEKSAVQIQAATS